jgi:hypothetical protein
LIASRTIASVALASIAHAQASVISSFTCDGITAQRLADTNGDGRQELILIQTSPTSGDAKLLRLALDSATSDLGINGQINIADPTHTLVCIADMLPRAGDEIIIANPRRTVCVPWTIDGKSDDETIVLARRARFTIRVDQPQLSPFVIDLNQDGLLDLMLPSLRGVQPYFQESQGESGAPAFRRMDPITVPVSTSVDTSGSGLDQEWKGSIRIPQIDTEDVNGDQRPDLLTKSGSKRSFHLQRADGTFDEPIQIDITQFVDSTPKAVLDLGTTAVLSDAQLMQSGDINADGIPDYVIAHRRKIWTFLGNSSGPQFKKARTQAVADDVTAMLVIDLDADDRADLLTFRVQLPSVATLLLGLLQSIDIDVRAVAYPSEQSGFARKPKWRRTITVRVPPLLSLLSRQAELVERITSLVSKARISASGNFTSPGQRDLALVREDTTAIDLFPNVQSAPKMDTREGSQMMRRLLFENENTVFDLERVFGLISGLLDQLSNSNVGNQKPSSTISLRDNKTWQLIDLSVGELNGSECDEILATYRAIADPTHHVFDVLGWK